MIKTLVLEFNVIKFEDLDTVEQKGDNDALCQRYVFKKTHRLKRHIFSQN